MDQNDKSTKSTFARASEVFFDSPTELTARRLMEVMPKVEVKNFRGDRQPVLVTLPTEEMTATARHFFAQRIDEAALAHRGPTPFDPFDHATLLFRAYPRMAEMLMRPMIADALVEIEEDAGNAAA